MDALNIILNGLFVVCAILILGLIIFSILGSYNIGFLKNDSSKPSKNSGTIL
jgi:hypothetical protein